MDSGLSRPQTEAVENQDLFVIDARNRSYKHQYSNIYFTRLHQLKSPVQEAAAKRWNKTPGSLVKLST
jgi:DNA polymerase delta subunit 2